jgi:ubiquinone/menaquinone biosynthesis C-methylase UbiE
MRRYDITAEMYDTRYAEEQEAKYKAALGCVTVEGGVLDVGCGTGLLFGHLVSKVESLVGTDLSKQLLLRAKARAEKHENVHLVQADADHLPFRNNLFSAILAITVLQNMPRPLETIREAKRTGKHCASIVISGLKKAFSPELFRQLLESSGLRVISVIDEDSLNCYIGITSKNR